jgi:hypothetical protein
MFPSVRMMVKRLVTSSEARRPDGHAAWRISKK